MAMIPHVVTYNANGDNSTVLTVPAGKVFIVTWSSHGTNGAPVLGALSGRLIMEGSYTANQITPPLFFAPNGDNIGIGGQVILTGWLKDI